MTTIEPPAEHHLPEGARNARSIVIVNTGEGKGKSTAAFGIVLRAVAREWKVAVVQFLKSGDGHVGEEDVARRLGVDWLALGEGFTWDSANLTQDEAVAQEAWKRAQELIRAVARDWKVAVVQFLKSGDWHVGEEDIARRLGVDWWAMGEGFTWDSANITQDQAVAQAAWERAQSLIRAGEHRLVVLDEITYPMTWEWISTDDVVATIRERPEHVSVVATGRDAPDALVDVADTVTEMRKIKHAFDTGVLAKKGIDY